MTPTPRTDEATFTYYENWELRSKSVVMDSVARTLETELTAMTAERDQLREWTTVNGVSELQRERDALTVKLHNARQRGNEFRDALDAITAERDAARREAAIERDKHCHPDHGGHKFPWENDTALAPASEGKEIDAITAERDALKDQLDDIHNATLAAMGERCDMSERHCSCVPLLRAECKRLSDALQAMVKERDGIQSAIREVFELDRTPVTPDEVRDSLRAEVAKMMDKPIYTTTA